MYPHYLNPLPSMAIARFSLGTAQGELTEGQLIPAGTELETPPIDGEPYRFRTAYPVQLWPVEVVDAGLQSGLFRAGIKLDQDSKVRPAYSCADDAGDCFDLCNEDCVSPILSAGRRY